MTVRILGGDCRAVLATEPANHYHLAVCSPPYWGLRSYGTEPQVWPDPDGTPLCDGEHEWGRMERGKRCDLLPRDESTSTSRMGKDDRQGSGPPSGGHFCLRCHAWLGELGSEPTVERYLANLVAVFDAVGRVLRDDATCWVNLAGSYMNNPGGQNGTTGALSAKSQAANGQAGRQERTASLQRGGWLKPLDYVDVPGLFAHAMQVRGWLWRSDIALVKKAPMPESVQGWSWQRCRVKVAASANAGGQSYNGAAYGGTPQGAPSMGSIDGSAQWQDCPGCARCEAHDGLVLRRGNGRPTRSWERFLVFAKKAGAYWDTEAVREPLGPVTGGRQRFTGTDRYASGFKLAPERGDQNSRGLQTKPDNPAGRNLRDWQFWPHAATKEAHYAAYPIALPQLAIKAGTSERCCPACGAPWARVVEHTPMVVNHSDRVAALAMDGYRTQTSGTMVQAPSSRTTGWRPTCSCRRQDWTAARVLDPFGGSGSTGIAADRLGRDVTLVDLNPEYTRISVKRVTQDAPLLTQVLLEAADG